MGTGNIGSSWPCSGYGKDHWKLTNPAAQPGHTKAITDHIKCCGVQIYNENTSYFNEHRPHQGIGNIVPTEYSLTAKRQGGIMLSNVAARNIVRKDFLGGLLKGYRRAA